ncbi:MAG: hypothetical protein GY825_10555, partial [Phycisphaeraceae bacterium]|nr:hypothetical protein [Phycisphaeraceae bacterium]
MNDPSDIGHDHAPDHADHRDQGSPMRIASLSDPDRDAVDRLFEDGFDADAVNEGDAREDALRSLLGNLEAYPTESSSDTLVDATLAGIDRHESARRQQFTLPPHDERSPRGFHLPPKLFLRVPDLNGDSSRTHPKDVSLRSGAPACGRR